MARIPAILDLAKPAWNSCLFDGVPMWRAQAWALHDARLHGVTFTVNSAIRREDIVKRYRGKGLRPGYSSQEFLYDGFRKGLPGFFPANPPNRTSHAGYSDGNRFFRVPAEQKIEKFMWGIDLVDRPGGDAAQVVRWLNDHGYKAIRPYNVHNERHHMCFSASPASNARRRLAAHYAGRKHKR